MKTSYKFAVVMMVSATSFGFVSAPAYAQTTANGPYYATPSWDQTLPASTRFIVLSNMASAAVLDRETGLVWERSPSTALHPWVNARLQCTGRAVGGRKGWRLPSVHELASLLDPNNPGGDPDLPPGHPFINVQSSGYWSATNYASLTSLAWLVLFGVGSVSNAIKDDDLFVWCVRGGMNADAY